jgi:hypothetical protein
MLTELYQWLVSYKLPVIFVVLIFVVIIDLSLRLVVRFKILKEFKNLKPLDILLKRYAMGRIRSRTLDKMWKKVASLEELEIQLKLLETQKISWHSFQERKSKLIEKMEAKNSSKKNE